MLRLLALLAVAALALSLGQPARAQNDLRDIPDPDPEIERKSFIVADGFEVNLYAADPLLAKPIQINFDPAGRLWVASSEVYPQIAPGQKANDKVLVLEDTDGDGQADKTTVFADGLLIPTGVAPGDGGAYVSNSTELLHLADTNGDGRADKRRIMLSGFGTEDTHHILHTLRWGPEGLLYMNQSIYIHSHVETPYGVRRLDGGGIWHFRPETMQLEVFARGFVNTWGHDIDKWGQSFATDGAYGEGINFVFPGATFVAAPGAARILKGMNPGSPKHCGLEIVGGRHLPKDWQGNMITSDFRAHRVCRFVVNESPTGSGYVSQEMPELVKTTHVAFRPIDAKLGPDGAIYIADWYNPIIQHGEVDFRDPRRDHVHGRIWRVSAKGRDVAPRPKLEGASVNELVKQLASPEPFTRTQAKRVLKEQGAAKVLPALAEWLGGLDPKDAEYDHRRLEALWTHQSVDHVEPGLLKELLRSPDHRVRAAATRVLYHWWPRVPDAVPLLAVQVEDDHPRVRLEAVNALAQMHTLEAAALAARALDRPLDENLDFALWRALRSLQDVWLPAVTGGQFDFDGHPQRLLFALQSVGSPGVVGPLLALVREGKIPAEREDAVLALVGTLGGPEELGFVFDAAVDAKSPATRRARLLAALQAAARSRQVKPAGDLAARLGRLARDNEGAIAAEAARLIGLWKLTELRPALAAALESRDGAPEVKLAAVEALADLQSGDDRAILDVVSASDASSPALRRAAVAALARFDLPLASTRAAALLSSPKPETEALVQAFLDRKEGPAALAGALASVKLSPDVAKTAVRTVRTAAREEAALVAALSKAGGLSSGPVARSPEELAKLAQDVLAHGDPARGELVFRRAELTCLKCHAIGGAGGQVGPDLSSIGASAQVDYLIESILEPGKKIKENYHSLVVVTDEGRVVTGVKVRETPDSLILRDAEDREVVVPLASIDEQNDGGSLMPAGLVDALSRDDLVDLVRFLSQLGKVGEADTPFAVGKTAVVRRWEALIGDRETLGKLMANGPDELTWAPVYSRVSGTLPMAGTPKIPTPQGDGVHIVRFELEAAAEGPAKLVFGDPANLQLWVKGQQIQLSPTTEITVPAGRTAYYVVVPSGLRQELRVELEEVPGSPAQARIVGGK